MFWIKFILFSIYSVGVVIFMYYTDLTFFYNYYKDWLFCDFKNESVFDFIVVGAGSAGSILATRLSNNGGKTLLIEAGGAASYFFGIPVISPLLINTSYDWQYVTVPQKNACKALINNQSAWPAGKILGGSSRINYMIYSRGHPDDYESWLPDFKEPLLGNGGLLHVEKKSWHSDISDSILKGIKELNLTVQDINKGSSTGFMNVHLTMKNGERWSADKSMHSNFHKRLTILINSMVSKVLFKHYKAVGVEFYRFNKIFRAYARKGVVISAGTIGSSKLLMLSGVGPKDHLRDLNIKNIVDLPVGKNLMDHITTGLDLVTVNDKAMSIADVVNPISMFKYYFLGKGPWTSAGVDIIGTIHSKFKKNHSSAPDLQFMIFPIGLSQDNGVLLRKNLRIPDEIYFQYFAPLAYNSSITIAPVLLHPKSTGEITLRSSNPFDSPLIDPKYLSHQDDVLVLIQGIEFVKKLIGTEAMKKVGAKLYKQPFPRCKDKQFDTSEYWECYIRHLTLTSYHPVGTCKMGRVVDPQFRVYGTKNLFVVDASVIPMLPSGNTHVPVVMLSEKAAKLISKGLRDCNNNLKVCCVKDIFYLSKNMSVF